MIEVEASNLNDYIGKKFIYEANILGVDTYTEGILVSVETYTSDLGYGDHVVTYTDLDGDLYDFFAFGHSKFKIMN